VIFIKHQRHGSILQTTFWLTISAYTHASDYKKDEILEIGVVYASTHPWLGIVCKRAAKGNLARSLAA
jgi:hypothetical protein